MKLMKSFVLGSLLVAGLVRAESTLPVETVTRLVSQLDQVLSVQNKINWKVGDYHKLKVDFMFGGGDGRKEATKEEGNAIWYKNEINLMGQKQVTEALIDRATAKTIKLIVNGKEQSPDDGGKIDIIQQDETTLETPAGKFDCVYVKAKITSQGQTQEVELWVNPVDVNLDGMLKVIVQSQFGPVTMTLQEFGPK